MANISPISIDEGVVTADIAVQPRADEGGIAIAAAPPNELPLQVATEKRMDPLSLG